MYIHVPGVTLQIEVEAAARTQMGDSTAHSKQSEIVQHPSQSVESLVQLMSSIAQYLDNPHVPFHEVEGLIREELTLMNEHEKRKQFVIFKELNVTPCDGVHNEVKRNLTYWC